ncbi:uncharacterized protein RSE6_03955 [Rhynchosporium secalis]|uniref:Uncharacterized protein n=1 Tax=Rhynchosporium secalis TaxID=38038 RepID=A0A1E1M439_RHYSE|nr:uncharacterized protein RSE6_03955 [Rhynchosporium secalis]
MDDFEQAMSGSSSSSGSGTGTGTGSQRWGGHPIHPCIMHASCMHAMQTPMKLSVKSSPIAQEVHPPPTPRCPIWWNSLSIIPSIPCSTIRHQTSPEQSCREEGYIVPPLSSSGRHQYRYLQAGMSIYPVAYCNQSIFHSDTLAAIPPYRKY